MLDLQARIGLDESEIGIVGRVPRIDEKFERAEIVVVRSARERHRRARDFFAQARRERRARRDLDQLLVAPLDRAFALAEIDEPAMPIAENLDFDMPRALDQPLGIERSVAESARRFGSAAREGLRDLVRAPHCAHAAPAAAGHGLQHDRRMDLLEKGARLIRAAHGGAVDDGRADFQREFARFQLVAEQVERLGGRANERYARRSDGARETCVLRQKAVAGMDSVAARLLRQRDDARGIEIGGHPRFRQGMRLVRLAHMQRRRIVLRMDGDARYSQSGGGARDADGDLAAIGDQQFAERRRGHCFGVSLTLLCPTILPPHPGRVEST